MGEPRGRVQAVQPPQGRPHARGGADPPDPAAVRAAQRPLLAVHAVPRRTPATRPGGPTSSSAGTDARRGPTEAAEARLADARPGAGPRRARPAPRAPATRRTSWAGRCATRSSAASPRDWDLATDALPGPAARAVPGRRVRERVRDRRRPRRAARRFEVTTFRTEHEYADFRRPHRVEFGADLRADLARRDFTVNAMAWGRPGGGATTHGAASTRSTAARTSRRGVLRAVGDPAARFREDALRMVRAVRLAATLGFEVEPATLDAIRSARRARRRTCRASGSGPSCASCSRRPSPSVGLRLAETTGLLAVISPDLAAQRGIPQNKVAGEDLWDHTLRTVDAAPAGARSSASRRSSTTSASPRRSPTASSATTKRSGRGSRGVAAAAARAARADRRRSSQLVRHHMFEPTPDCRTPRSGGSSQARRARRTSTTLFALRRADDIGSGLPAGRRPRSSRSGPGSTPSSRRGVPLDRTALGDRRRRPDARARPGAGAAPRPRAGRAAGAGASRTRRSTSRATLLLLAQGILADMDGRGRRMIELLLQAERALAVGPASTRPSGCTARRPTRTPATRSPSSGWPGWRSSAATSRGRWRLGAAGARDRPGERGRPAAGRAARGGVGVPRRVAGRCRGARHRGRSRRRAEPPPERAAAPSRRAGPAASPAPARRRARAGARRAAPERRRPAPVTSRAPVADRLSHAHRASSIACSGGTVHEGPGHRRRRLRRLGVRGRPGRRRARRRRARRPHHRPRRRGPPGARLVRGHATATRPLVRALLADEGIEAILHCAARSLVGESMQDPARYYRDNVAGGITLLEAARAAGVDRVVFSSTAAVYGVPATHPHRRGRAARADQHLRRDQAHVRGGPALVRRARTGSAA